MIAFEELIRAGGAAAIRHAGEFFMGTDPVHLTLRAICNKLDSLGIHYAVVGALALGAHGFVRNTVDVDILLTRQGSQRAHEQLNGLGYIPPFKGSRNLRDTQTGVRIEFLITGDYPGDGKPKPVAFPDPAAPGVTMIVEGIHYLSLEKLFELKLASGMTNANRLKDLGDVQELIRTVHPQRELGNHMNEFVRNKYFELWDGMQNEPPEQ